MVQISKRLAQQIVDTVKDVCGYDINFIDRNGIIFASTSPNRIGSFHELGYEVIRNGVMREVDSDDTFHGTKKGINSPIIHNGECIAVIGISGEVKEVRKYISLARRITGLLIREQELEAVLKAETDKVKYIIHSLINEQQINNSHLKQCLEEFKISTTEKYKVLIIQTLPQEELDKTPLLEQELIQLFHSSKLNLYAFDYPNTYIILIPKEQSLMVCVAIKNFIDTHQSSIHAGLGSLQPLDKLNISYQSALLALKTLDKQKQSFVNIESLDLQILLYGLDEQQKNHLLNKTLNKLSLDDWEILKTYYETEMSLNQTAQMLYMHKNTLQYKLDRITKLCGYNPRHFKDATVLYYALLLVQ